MRKQQEQLVKRLRDLAGAIERDSIPGDRLKKMKQLAEQLEQLAERQPDHSAAIATGSFKPTSNSPILIWCDGSCSPNPGPGGWGALIEQDGKRMELSGADPNSTNNIMELTAAIEAIERTPEGSETRVITDSQYLVNGITRWLAGWKRKGWRKADGEPVLNQELWRKLDALTARRKVTWEWVRGHTGHPENERSDRLANEAREAL